MAITLQSQICDVTSTYVYDVHNGRLLTWPYN